MVGAVVLLALAQAMSLPESFPDGPAGLRIRTVTLDPVHYTQSTPLAGNGELARRALTPLQADQLPELLAARHAQLADQPVAVAQERFGEHVPPTRPASGHYGLVVFVPPWQSAELPAEWISALDAAGMIVVSAARQGNAESPLGRRQPLALLAAWNAIERYPIDPERVFVAGFSGGAKVALKLALAYPDLFSGALLDAGAYPIGGEALPIPPAELFDRFRSHSRIVLLAGDHDSAREEQAEGTASLKGWCVANVTARLVDGLAHEPVSGPDFGRALAALTTPPRAPTAALDTCWQRRLAERDAALAAAKAVAHSGHQAAARRALLALDRKYGGLAAPASIVLWVGLDPALR
ncbi:MULTISPECIES: PHB depolymerase family esterase [Sphingomonas]|uniref:PHB depolymerase family esterase n=1 Tax=Sphingomonas TaxID=13687 RepID=UPI000DEF7281|nr:MULTISPECIES: PHB depolymerase family esterase [Sphingomonas]